MNYQITIEDHKFNPASLTISVNDTVTWVNNDAMKHTATRTAPPAFDTGRISPGTSSLPVTFQQISPADGFEYFCQPHPYMRARIIVTEIQ